VVHSLSEGHETRYDVQEKVTMVGVKEGPSEGVLL
jgi:hypothetical protein